MKPLRLTLSKKPAAGSAPAPKRSKYGNRPQQIGAEKYRSRREAKRHQQLLGLQAAGLLANLRREVPFELVPKQRKADGKAERSVVYIADFVYTQRGVTVVEDLKSPASKTPAYVIKRKLMLLVHRVTLLETS